VCGWNLYSRLLHRDGGVTPDEAGAGRIVAETFRQVMVFLGKDFELGRADCGWALQIFCQALQVLSACG
jgi:hypothetical protein